MNQLYVALMGAPEVRCRSERVTFPTRKTLALLSYLAVEGGVQPRERIIALLWPESSTHLGRASLRKALAYLREALGDYALPDDDQPCILATRDALQLNPVSVRSADVWLLQAAAQAIRKPPLGAPDTRAAWPSAYLHTVLEPLQQAVTHLRGDLLAGFSLSDAPEFDDWASMQRDVLHRQAVQVCDQLAQLQFEAGELASAITTATRWVAIDDLDEEAYRRLMQLHVANGDRSAALQVYATCTAILARDLGIEPVVETTRLADRIKASQVTKSPDDRVHIHAPVSTAPYDRLASSPMFGRAFEHGQLVAAYRALHSGQPQVITLEGEPGIGKTRLATEFLAWAGAQGATLLQSRALAGGHLPYQPIVEALRSLPAPADLARLAPIWLAELSRLVPELVELVPNLTRPMLSNEADVRLRLFEAIARAGQLVAESTPLVVFIDDMQWADPASRDVLHYAARHWAMARLPVLLICALRSDDVATTPALSEWLAALRRDCRLTRLAVNVLSLEDTQHIVRAVIVRDTQSTLTSELTSFSQRLFAETSGHPLFIVQTLRSLAERGLLQRDQHGTWHAQLDPEMPYSIRDLIQQRLARLSQTARACCAAGAVLGGDFQFTHLCEVLGMNEREALVGLEELLTRGLLHETVTHETTSAPRYGFTHDRLREVAYAQLSEARRRIFHTAALAALQTSAGPAQLADHAVRAGLAPLAAQYSLRAGEASFQIFAIADAIHHFERVRQFYQTSDLNDEAERRTVLGTLYLHLGRAYELQNQIGQARTVYEDMQALAHLHDDRVSECVALNRLATIQAQTMRNMERALTLLQSALVIAEASGNNPVLIETMWNLAQVHFYGGCVGIALPYAERALMLAQQLDHAELIARSLNMLAYLTGNPARWADSERYAVAAQKRYSHLGNRAMEADCWSLIARANVGLGQPAMAIHAGKTAVAIAEEIENDWGQVSTHFSLAIALLEAGDHKAALEHAQQAVAIGQARELYITLAVAHLVLGNVYRAGGNLQAARQSHLEAERLIVLTESPFRYPVAVALCADCALEDAWEEAYSWACKALATRESSNDFDGDLSFWHLIEALLHSGQGERAQAEVQRFGDEVAHLPRYRIPHLRALAVLAQWEQDGGRASTYLEEARTLTVAIGLPDEQNSITAQLAALDGTKESRPYVWNQEGRRNAGRTL
ncbi:MAG: AAA family ATPase [Herpetosiphon sp.]